MPGMVYKAVSAGVETSLRGAVGHRADVIVAANGRGFDHELLSAGLTSGCPVIVCGSARGEGDRPLEAMLEAAGKLLAASGVPEARVAVIRSQVDPGIVVEELRAGRLMALGNGLHPGERGVRESTVTGQMGVHPIMAALEAGAQFIFVGRACAASLYAADMIRRGIDAGLAYHAGKVLAASAADGLVAEIHDDGSAIFTAAAEEGCCTPASIALQSIDGEIHPQLQFYPEGVLVLDRTQYFARDERSAGLRGSQFLRTRQPWPLSIKLEGTRGQEWSVHHLLRNATLIREKLFAVECHRVSAGTWTRTSSGQPRYFDIGGQDLGGLRTDRMISLIADAPLPGPAGESRTLGEMACTIRSHDVGGGQRTFDLVFGSAADYETALRSNLFFSECIASVLGMPAAQVIGSYFVDACHAIKISIDRSGAAAASQCARLERLRIPSCCLAPAT